MSLHKHRATCKFEFYDWSPPLRSLFMSPPGHTPVLIAPLQGAYETPQLRGFAFGASPFSLSPRPRRQGPVKWCIGAKRFDFSGC
jgi:hypothetical protein